MKTFTYHKTERLKGYKATKSLFEDGNTFLQFPFKVFYIIEETAEPGLKAGVGVSKRLFRKAADRNRIKRLLREAYRLNKPHLAQTAVNKQLQLSVFLLYIDKSLLDMQLLNGKMPSVIKKLTQKLIEKAGADN